MKYLFLLMLTLFVSASQAQRIKRDTAYNWDTMFIKHLWATGCFLTNPPQCGNYVVVHIDTIIAKSHAPTGLLGASDQTGNVWSHRTLYLTGLQDSYFVNSSHAEDTQFALPDNTTNIKIIGRRISIRESPELYDTVKIIMLVTDTFRTRAYSYYQYGYEVRKLANPNKDKTDTVRIEYLDENKNRLKKSILVWVTMDY